MTAGASDPEFDDASLYKSSHVSVGCLVGNITVDFGSYLCICRAWRV